MKITDKQKQEYGCELYNQTTASKNGEELSGFLMNKLSHGLIKNSGGLVECNLMCTC